MKRFKLALIILATYISLTGIVTFTLFILEESIQTCIFGTWPAKSARQWHIVMAGLDTINGINRTMKIINYSAGWIQPFAFVSYRAYAKATDFYILGVQAEIFAHEPLLFVDREVYFKFVPNRIDSIGDGLFIIGNDKLKLMLDYRPELEPFLIDGILKKETHYLTIEKKED